MINAAYYFLDDAMIIREEGSHRLIVLKKARVLMDREYKTTRGARIAFSKSTWFKSHAKGKDGQPEWSYYYKPDNKWFEERGLRLMKDEDTGREYVITVI